MTKEIDIAIRHIREFHPDIEIVIFNKDGRWQYMTADFECPVFNYNLDVSILEEAADSVLDLPAIFQF